MKIIDNGIIIHIGNYSDNSKIISILTQKHGIKSGLIKINKKNKNWLQIGSIVNSSWSGKSIENLGTYTAELIQSININIFYDYAKLLALNSAISYNKLFIAENDASNNNIYKITEELINNINQKFWQYSFISFELNFLASLGFGINIANCFISNKQNIYYISPKTGNAVSKIIGEPYHKSLFVIPEIIKYKKYINNLDLLKALHLTKYFINNRLCLLYKKKIPYSRLMLENKIKSAIN